MKRYLASGWTKAGLALVVFGWGPLLVIVALAAVGLWPDPNPNPVGPGLLFFFTAWPAIICVGIGVWQVRRREGAIPTVSHSRESPANWRAWLRHPATRAVAAIAGPLLIVRGAVGVRDGEGRGAVSAILLGVAAVYWAVVGRMPFWFRR